MSIEWRDETTFAKGDEEKIPRIWKTKIGELTITVHRHIDYLEYWLLTCDELWIRREVLKNIEIEGAKREALVRMRDTLMKKTEEYLKVIKSITNEV